MELENIVANTVYLKAREGGQSQKKGRSKKWREMLAFPHPTECEEIRASIDCTYDYVVGNQPIGRELFRMFCRSTVLYSSLIALLDDIESFEVSLEEERTSRASQLHHEYFLEASRISEVLRPVLAADTSSTNFSLSQPGEEVIPAPASSSSSFYPNGVFHVATPAASDTDRTADHPVASPKCLSPPESATSLPEAASTSTAVYPSAGSSLVPAHDDAFTDMVRLSGELHLSSPPPRNLFATAAHTARAHLSDRVFPEFVQSEFFTRFLQWKWLEMRPISKKSFRMYRVLGKGGFGEVCACQVRTSGKMYAMKKLEKARVKARHAEKMALSEKSVLENVHSRFIVNLAYAFQTKEEICLVLTLMNGGDLKFHIYNVNFTPGLEMDRAVFYTAEISLGLEHLHDCNIVYRDLKPENILLDDSGHVRISDLGLAVSVASGRKQTSRVGTVGYMAPEVIAGRSYRFSPDWWGLGCLLYEMIAGAGPFRRHKERVKREEVDRRVRDEEPIYGELFTPAAVDMCSRLLRKTASERLCSAEELRRQPLFFSVDWKRLAAGVISPPFCPDPRAVYCKDVLDIEQFPATKGVKYEASDRQFWDDFNSGAVSVSWQLEMLEMDVFTELNTLDEDGRLNVGVSSPPPGDQQRSLFRRFISRISSSSKSAPGTIATDGSTT